MLYAHYISPLVLHATHTHNFHPLDLTMIGEQYIYISALNIMCLCPVSNLANLKPMDGIGSPCYCSLEKLFVLLHCKEETVLLKQLGRYSTTVLAAAC
jgi:hypothetical protein